MLGALIERIAGRHVDDTMENCLAVNAVNGERIAEEDARLSCGMTGEEHAILRSFLEALPEYL